MDIKPYIVLDIETTGLLLGNQILQVALISDDGKTPIKDINVDTFFVNNEDEVFTGRLEPQALAMNAWIFDQIAGNVKKKYPVLKSGMARAEFKKILLNHYHKLDGQSITFAGKNIGSFDLPHLRNNNFIDEELDDFISHRIIDVGSLYFPDFGKVPTQQEINDKIGRKNVTHDAVDDAMDIVCSIRSKLGIAV